MHLIQIKEVPLVYITEYSKIKQLH